ncbi:hypothetical protein G3O08_16035 [Cryomorpha ignava]|uniref:Outer membrane beta-barrel protein n=1 Tax=Cryomorpha ignava TaxID=101383 RepID=A0A7K3WVE1_9FLAO|nr:hypothetical protein [Cryomorpha ignava]NEN25011.1 hypothetical protein [Cryomorpha ignava]
MITLRRISTLIAFIVFSQVAFAQGNFRFPSLNDARNGHLKAFKIPKVNDFKKFTKGYGKQLAILDRRSEKAYRKSFLKFIDLEDKLLYTLCDSNAFRANALMRSAAASFGKMETDRNNKPQTLKSQKQKVISAAVKLSEENIPGLNTQNSNQAEVKHKANQKKYGSKYYADYMKKRVHLYKTTFKEGTKQQKKMLRKLRKRALLWQSYKEQDSKLLAGFADKHMGIMKSLEAKPEFASIMKPQMADYSGTQLDPKMNASSFSQTKLLDMLQKKITADGLLSPDQVNGAKNVKELFAKLQKVKQEVNDTTSQANKKETKEKPVKIDGKSSKRFWDRLYGGADFDWENSTGYYPDGLGVTLDGGYHISDNSGLTIELQTVFNASKMGWANDKRFESTLVSNYTIGANIDYRIWKVFFAGIGSEFIINNIEAPAPELIQRLENPKYTFGIPLIFRVLLPISGANSTNIEFRYDLNSKNNIKPQFDFKVGFLIGR